MTVSTITKYGRPYQVYTTIFCFVLKVQAFCEIADIAQLSAMVIADRTVSASGRMISSDLCSSHPETS